MRSKDSRIPPRLGTQAPERPVPLPLAVTGMPASFASRSTLETWSVFAGLTTTSGTRGSTVSASSCA